MDGKIFRFWSCFAIFIVVTLLITTTLCQVRIIEFELQFVFIEDLDIPWPRFFPIYNLKESGIPLTESIKLESHWRGLQKYV
jgi:hypothetical protein